MQAKFIVLEGIDGAGKTTQLRLLDRTLTAAGQTVFLTAEPTGGETGVRLRRMLSGELPSTPEELTRLFTADRVEHNREISAHLAAGEVVLCDRYYYSTLAYQGKQCNYAWVADLQLNNPDIRRPDACIFLDLTPKESMERIRRGRDSVEIFETQEQLTRIRQSFFDAFDDLNKRGRGEAISVLSAAGTPEEVAARIRAALGI